MKNRNLKNCNLKIWNLKEGQKKYTNSFSILMQKDKSREGLRDRIRETGRRMRENRRSKRDTTLKEIVEGKQLTIERFMLGQKRQGREWEREEEVQPIKKERISREKEEGNKEEERGREKGEKEGMR